jgi:hypothetical protein
MSILIQEYVDQMDYNYELWNYSDSLTIHIKIGQFCQDEQEATPLKLTYNKKT